MINKLASIIIFSDNRMMNLEIISETFKFVWPIYSQFLDYLIEIGNHAINNKKKKSVILYEKVNMYEDQDNKHLIFHSKPALKILGVS